MNPINKPAAPAVGWQQARVLEMQAEYADAFDTQTGSYDEMCAAYGEERKMWNSGGPEMEETIEYQIWTGIMCIRRCMQIRKPENRKRSGDRTFTADPEPYHGNDHEDRSYEKYASSLRMEQR